MGAALGEIVLGKKIGNRALIWGAIGETIPDLDVFGNLFLDSIDALAFHRGFTHSILFSIIAPFIFGGIVHQLYHTGAHRSWPYKIFVFILNVALIASFVWGINFIFSSDHHPRWWLLILTVGIGAYLGWRLYKYYLHKDLESFQTSFSNWYLLFFLTFSTHILLDCCTAFGTQAFLPFSYYRVAFDNIAVADPFYTIPFLFCIIIVACLRRGTRVRFFVNWLGIAISTAYMAWTITNKVHVNNIFESALDNREIEVIRWRTGPTILNNILWSCVAEDEEQFYVGQYSLFDTDPNLHYLNVIPKNDSIHQALLPLEDYQTLLWFSKGYLAAFPTDSILILSDLRFGSLHDTIRGPQDLIFNFNVREVNGELEFTDTREPPQGDISEQLKKFIKRIKGY